MIWIKACTLLPTELSRLHSAVRGNTAPGMAHSLDDFIEEKQASHTTLPNVRMQRKPSAASDENNRVNLNTWNDLDSCPLNDLPDMVLTIIEVG